MGHSILSGLFIFSAICGIAYNVAYADVRGFSEFHIPRTPAPYHCRLTNVGVELGAGDLVKGKNRYFWHSHAASPKMPERFCSRVPDE